MTQHGDEAMSAPGRIPWGQVIAGLAIALVLIVGGILYYRSTVCDQEVTQAGAVVTVCRRLQTTDPPIAGLGLVALLALTAFFTEINGFGFSLKRQVDKVRRTADEALTTAVDAKASADSARSVSQMAEDVTIGALTARTQRRAPDQAGVQQEIEHLAAAYDEIRRNQVPGPTRTTQMTAQASKMISLLAGAAPDLFDVGAHLQDEASGGRRLAGYAHVYANPDPRLTRQVVQALTAEDTAFGQYWAIRALHRLVACDPLALEPNTRRELERFLATVEPASDRAYELRRVLAS